VRATLSAALTQSTKWGLTVRNPVPLVDAPRRSAKEPSPLVNGRSIVSAGGPLRVIAGGHMKVHASQVMWPTERLPRGCGSKAGITSY
jgi:hypothetical protein